MVRWWLVHGGGGKGIIPGWRDMRQITELTWGAGNEGR